MSPRHFSSKGGPYFVGQTFSQHKEHQDKLEDKGLGVVPIIGKLASMLKFPRFKKN